MVTSASLQYSLRHWFAASFVFLLILDLSRRRPDITKKRRSEAEEQKRRGTEEKQRVNQQCNEPEFELGRKWRAAGGHARAPPPRESAAAPNCLHPTPCPLKEEEEQEEQEEQEGKEGKSLYAEKKK